MKFWPLFVLVCCVSCDKQPESPPIAADTAPPPAPPPPPEPEAKPLEVEGTLTAKDGTELRWKQAIDPSHILDLALCTNRVYALARGGRIVEWGLDPVAPKQVLSEFGAVTSIDANDRYLLAGTADGRILRSSCTGDAPETAPDSWWPVQWVHLDARSKKRVFVGYKAPISEERNQPEAAVTLVDLENGDVLRDPFHKPWPKDGHPIGFVDYRGELWFGLTPKGEPSGVWYLERFDQGMPPIAGLGEQVIHGFIQMSREVWAYGGTVDGSMAMVYRVDSNRAKPMFDGKKGWYGEPPGGDPLAHPIVAMHKWKKELMVATTHDVFWTDIELRRFKKIASDDPRDGVLATATAPVEINDKVLLGTHHGLVVVGDDGWSRNGEGAAPDATAPVSPLATEVEWRERKWAIAKKGVTTAEGNAKPRPLRHGPRKAVHGFHVDASDRLWVFGDDGIWLLSGPEKGNALQWDATPVGLTAANVAAIGRGATPDSITMTTTYEGQFSLSVAAARTADVDL